MGNVAALTQDSLFWPGATLSELLLQHRFRIVGLGHVQAVLAAFLSPVEIPVRTPLCSGLRVGPVLELEDAPAVVPALNDAALLNKPLTSLLNGFADAFKLRSTQVGDGGNDLVGSQERAPSSMCIHINTVALCFRRRNRIV